MHSNVSSFSNLNTSVDVGIKYFKSNRLSSFKKLIMSEYELTSFEKEFTPFKNLRLNAILTSSQPTSHFFPLHALFFLSPLSIKLDLYRAP